MVTVMGPDVVAGGNDMVMTSIDVIDGAAIATSLLGHFVEHLASSLVSVIPTMVPLPFIAQRTPDTYLTI